MNQRPGQPGLRGVYNVVPTPFRTDETLDTDSLRTLLRGLAGFGVDGVTILGVAGEAHALVGDERRAVLDTVADELAGTLPFVVGVSQRATTPTVALARTAADAGASALMIAPPQNLAPGAALTAHFAAVAEAVDVPIVLQDFPLESAVTMSPAQMADLVAAVPAIRTIKLEDQPTGWRTRQTKELIPDDVTILGGLGAMFLLSELRHGADGAMTGFAVPEALVEIVAAFTDGDEATAAAVYAEALPAIQLEGQLRIGLALRKHAFAHRGLIASSTVRGPSSAPGPAVLAEYQLALDELLAARAQRRAAVPG